MYVSSIVGDSIKGYCKENKISQAELARKADVAESTISNIVNNRCSPTIDTTTRIARAMGCTLTKLLEKGERNDV